MGRLASACCEDNGDVSGHRANSGSVDHDPRNESTSKVRTVVVFPGAAETIVSPAVREPSLHLNASTQQLQGFAPCYDDGPAGLIEPVPLNEAVTAVRLLASPKSLTDKASGAGSVFSR